MITAEKFKEATGYEAKDDDLERSNCTEAGTIGHLSCGWDEEADLPWFMSPNAPAHREKIERALFDEQQKPKRFEFQASAGTFLHPAVVTAPNIDAARLFAIRAVRSAWANSRDTSGPCPEVDLGGEPLVWDV